MPPGKGNLRPADNPKPFTTTNQPTNRSGPVKLFSQLAKEWKARGIERATAERVIEVYEHLLALPLTEIIELAGSNEDAENPHPAIVRMAAQEMIGKRKGEILEKMLDRAHGKATQRTELTGKEGGEIKVGVDLSKLSLEDKIKLRDIAKKAKSNE